MEVNLMTTQSNYKIDNLTNAENLLEGTLCIC